MKPLAAEAANARPRHAELPCNGGDRDSGEHGSGDDVPVRYSGLIASSQFEPPPDVGRGEHREARSRPLAGGVFALHLAGRSNRRNSFPASSRA
jgi:hypothetical protein